MLESGLGDRIAGPIVSGVRVDVHHIEKLRRLRSMQFLHSPVFVTLQGRNWDSDMVNTTVTLGWGNMGEVATHRSWKFIPRGTII